MNVGVLSWLNETSLSPYPLARSYGYDGFIVDANFIQFDYFIPILNTITVDDVNITLNITFDLSTESIELPLSFFTGAGVFSSIRANNRYIGKLVFGSGVNAVISELNNSTFTVNTPFLSHLVKSIPTVSGVYSIDNLYGDLTFDSNGTVFYEEAGNITFNAVATANIDTSPYLKTLNSVVPILNNVYLKDSEVIKITSNGPSQLLISMVGSADALSNDVIPTSNP
jgi:hypothetical protein